MSSGRRHALVIGIDTYPDFGPEAQLCGAVHDALAMAEVLTTVHGFAESDVRLRLGPDATRQRILAEMDRLVERVATGDEVLLFFSGHGSQVTDREGDEGDGLDETLVPVDSAREGWGKGKNRDITDDEIHRWASEVLAITPHLVLLFDCCHAATLHRPLWPVRSVPADRRPVHRLPPSPIGRDRDIDAGPSPTVLSACGDLQLAYELPAALGQPRGVFSHALVRGLAEAGPSTTWRELAERVRAEVADQPVDQVPSAAGEGLDRPIFGGAGRAAGRTRSPVPMRAPAPRDRALRGTGPRDTATVLLDRAMPREAEAGSRGPGAWHLAPWKLRVWRSKGGPWTAIEWADGSAPVFEEGERLRIDLRHRHRRKLFVYLLDIGLGGRVSQVFPELDGHEALDPGLTLTVGDRPGDELELYWPADVARGPDPGMGHLLVVAAEKRLSPSKLLTARLDDIEPLFVLVRPYRLRPP